MVNTMNQWWIGEINGGYTKKMNQGFCCSVWRFRDNIDNGDE